MEGDKPGSVDRLAPARGHLSGTSVSRGLLRPTRNSCAAGRHWFLLGLASGGVYHAVPVSRKRGGLLPHRFTLACAPPPRRANTRHRRSVLCCTFRRLSTPGSYPAPCPVKPGLSSNGAPQGTRPRPPLPPMGPVSVCYPQALDPGPASRGQTSPSFGPALATTFRLQPC